MEPSSKVSFKISSVDDAARGHVAHRRRSLRRAVVAGATRGFAGGLAAGSSHLVPALRIMPRPTADRPGRPASMVIAHWVFGGVLAKIVAA